MSTADIESSPGLPDYLLSPNAVLNDTAQWRYGKAPDYSHTRRVYGETKRSSHTAGSLPQLVENLVKNWEIEASHKTSLSDWRTIDRENYSFSVNGGKDQTGEHMLKVGTYNAIISSPNEFYDGKTMGFDGSHKVFKGMMKSFAWEVVEVYSELPRVAFKWRHWGTMSGDYVGVNGKSRMVTVKAHGGPIDIQGISIATVDDQARIQRVETWFDPLEMFRQIAPDGIVTEEKIITQLDGSSEVPPVSKNESSQSGGQEDPISSEEEAAKENENENEKHQQVTTVIIETPRPAAVEEALDETNNPKSVEEESVGSTTEKVNSAVETGYTAAANLVQQSSTTDQINPPDKDEQFSTEPSSSLQSEQKDIIAIATTTTELAELPVTDEPPNQKVDEDNNLATESVPEPSQPPTPTIQSKTEILVGQPSESGASIITPSNEANDKNTQAAELIPYLDYNKDRRQQQQEVDRSSGQTPSPPTISILSEREREEETKPEPEQPPFVEIMPSALEERLRKLEARLARLEFMEQQHFVVVDSSSSIRSEIGKNGKNGPGTGTGMILGNNANANAGAGAGAGADVATTLLASEVEKKEEGKEEEEDRIKKEEEEEEDRIVQVVKKTTTDDAQHDDVANEEEKEKEKEKEKSRTATKVIGNEFSPSAAAVAGGPGCPFLNRG